MAINVGSVYLSSSIDSAGLQKGIYSVHDAATLTFDDIADRIDKSFSLTPVTNFNNGCNSTFGGIKATLDGFTPAVDTTAASFLARTSEMRTGMAGILDYVKTTFTADWDGAWKGLNTDFKEVCKSIGNLFGGSVNVIINGINTVFKGLNKLKINMPDWLGGGSFSFNLPIIDKIPLLAKGGIVTHPTLAMIGENGREAVMPLENNTGWITDLANQLSSVIAVQNSIGANSRQNSFGGVINLNIDGKKFAEAVIDDFATVSNRRGINISVLH